MHLSITLGLIGVACTMKIPPQRDIPDFQVTDFYTEVFPGQVNGEWQSFVEGNITLKPGEGPAYCYSWAPTSDPRVIPSFGNTTCQDDDAIVVSFQGDNATGYTYAVLWKESEHSLLSGSYHVGAGDFDYQDADGGARAAYYNGTNEFAIAVSQQVVTGDDGEEDGDGE